MLRMEKENALPADQNFENGFGFDLLVTLQYKDGRVEQKPIYYKSSAQKRVERGGKLGQ